MHALGKSIRYLVHRATVVLGALGLTLGCFLVLPLLKSIASAPAADTLVQAVDTANLPPPPPPPPEQEEEKEEEKPQEAPKLAEETPPLDLDQLALALNLGDGTGWGSGDFAIKLPTGADGASGESTDAIFQMADLDQKPRVIYQPSPSLSRDVRKKAPGTVYVIFVVDTRGRVETPMVQSSSDPVFEAPALSAVKQWKFEPAKRNGEPVKFRMRVPITFPKG